MIKDILKKAFVYSPKSEPEEFEVNEYNDIEFDVRVEKKIKKEYVSESYDDNYSYMKKRYRVPDNNDIVIRSIIMKGDRRAFVVFIEGMVTTAYVDDNIIKSLMELPYIKEDEAEAEISERFTTHAQMRKSNDLDIIADDINFGSCALFVEGVSEAFLFDVRGWEHRTIGKPDNEQSIYGPQEAFSEMLRTNTALVRKIVKTERLVALAITVGKVSRTRGVLLYIDGVANKKLVSEVKRRIDNISVDYVISIEELQMFISDKSNLITPQIVSTERPDRAARALTEGRCVAILNGSPRSLILPSNAFELMHVVSDEYLSVPFAVMSRLIRLTGMFLSLLLPALYLAITQFHHEIIPTYLLYSISAARENVPFPSLIELLLMDISFELIREAGIRMPSPIGSTLGIVGGLILGQAAVSAKIVSPIMIIVIAITGIGSFSTADYTLGWTYRVLRLMFIFLAAFMGFYGIAVGIVLYSLYLGSIKSFGVPFLSPSLHIRNRSMESAIMMNSVWQKEKRPDYLKTEDKIIEPAISRRWFLRNRRHK